MAKRKSYLGDPDPAESETVGVESADPVVEGEDSPSPNEPHRPWIGQRDPKVPLSASDAALIDAHEDRVVQHNLAQRKAGLPEALTKEEQDRIP